MNARMEAWPWLAHTQYQYATMLLARDQSGDGEKARELLKAALLTARELGMRAWRNGLRQRYEIKEDSSLREAVGDEAISFTAKDCFAPHQSLLRNKMLRPLPLLDSSFRWNDENN